jgi:hypothetical protein
MAEVDLLDKSRIPWNAAFLFEKVPIKHIYQLFAPV